MTDLFDQIWRNSVGFDGLLNSKHFNIPNFPFYNLSKTGENTYTIDLALAGYDESNIKITIDSNKLTISSEGEKKNSSEEYIHKGFTTKPFIRQFTLRDNIFVKSADMYNGILKIILEHVVPESKKPKEIKINVPQPKADKRLLLNEDSDF